MKIIDELISKLTYEVPVRDIRQGPFQTAVLTRNCGLASTPHDPGPHHDKSPVAEAGLLLEKDAKDLALLAKSPSLHEAAIGMATINSLIEVNEDDCVELNAGDLLNSKRRGQTGSDNRSFSICSQTSQGSEGAMGYREESEGR